MSDVLIIMGSISDSEVSKKVETTLDRFGVDYTVRILSAHRTHDELQQLLDSNQELNVIIAIAGKAAHLPGVVAAMSNALVIGVPVKTSLMGGMDSLLSIVQMPKGVPVSTVGINAGENAALLAIRALMIRDEPLKEKYQSYVKEMRDKVLEDDLNYRR